MNLICYFLSEPLGLEDFEIIALGEYLLLKVELWAEVCFVLGFLLAKVRKREQMTKLVGYLRYIFSVFL